MDTSKKNNKRIRKTKMALKRLTNIALNNDYILPVIYFIMNKLIKQIYFCITIILYPGSFTKEKVKQYLIKDTLQDYALNSGYNFLCSSRKLKTNKILQENRV